MRFAIIILSLILNGFSAEASTTYTLAPKAKAVGLLDHPANARLKKIIETAESSFGYTGAVLRVLTPASPRKVYLATTPEAAHIHRAGNLYAIIEREANRVGISPVVLLAIEVHETGWYTSPLWKYAHNPGGIKYRAFPGIKSWRYGRRRDFSAFETAEEGIRAHAYVLAHARYNAARETSDPYGQVNAIGRAGYCQPAGDWAILVRKYVRHFLNEGSLEIALVSMD